ncbi:MAG: LysR family transcriptional regulator, partial [Vibrio sp.]
ERKRNESYGLSHYSSIDLTNRDIAYHGHSLYGNMILSSQSDYITVVPISMAMQFKDSLGLQILKPPFEHKPILNHLIWLPKFNNDPAHTWFRKEIENSAKIRRKNKRYTQTTWSCR